jgi:hypothetical protein
MAARAHRSDTFRAGQEAAKAAAAGESASVASAA